jgi:hypothetical protein
VRDDSWTVIVDVADGDVALTVRIDDAHSFGVEVVDGRARACTQIGPASRTSGEIAVSTAPVLFLRAVPARIAFGDPGPDTLETGVLSAQGETLLASLDGRYLSTEVAGGFTGRVVGIEALSDTAHVARFSYRGSPSNGR